MGTPAVRTSAYDRGHHENDLHEFRRALDERRRSLSKVSGDIVVATRGGDVPTAGDLDAARHARNAAWIAVRRSLFGSPSTESNADVATFRAPSMMNVFESLSEYEATVRRADEIADRLFREADRVASISALSIQRDNLASEITDLERRRDVLQKEREESWSRWVEVWKPSGIKPSAPSEMKDFLVVYAQLVDDVFRWRDAEAALAADRNHAADHSKELASVLADTLPSEGLARIMERAAAACDREARAQKEREAHVRDLEKAAAEVHDKRQVLERETADIEHWATLWEKALVEMLLPVETGPAEVEETLGVLAEIGKRVQDIQDKRRRLANIEQDEVSFRQRTIEMAERLEDPIADVTVEVLAASLVDRAEAAKQDNVKRRALLQQLEGKRRELAELGAFRKTAESQIETLCLMARVSLAADLPQAEERSKKIRELRASLANLERQLFDLGEGITLDALVAECEGLSVDLVTEQLAAIQEKMTAAMDGKAKADQDLGGAIQRLALVDGSGRAAEAAEEAEQHLATMAILVEEYARAKLAYRLLDDEIKQHREKNQAPIIRRASELFERLTLGSFVGIRGDDEGDDGKPVLTCVRPGGTRVLVEGLSDGSRDQLFLALRIASLERHFENNESIPFIVDDILVNFDDARSRASLEVLGELSRKTQVLFFTHHARVAELAKDVVSPAELSVHNLNELSQHARMRSTDSAMVG